VRAFIALTSLALAACYAFDDGRQQSWTFETRQSASEVGRQATLQLARAGYQVLHADDRVTEAEKQREVGSFHVLRVVVEDAGSDGTRVRVQAVSEEGTGGGRKRTRSVSSSALEDGKALFDALKNSNLRAAVPPPSS
jgi:hypothetical protein